MDTRSERRTRGGLVLAALVLFVAIDLGFVVCGFKPVSSALSRWARRLGAGAPRSGAHGDTARRTFEAVCIATRFYYRRRLDCLPKALTTHCLLLAQGVPTALCIGVRRYPFAGHAWVEAGGETLDDSPSALYRAGSYGVLAKF